jgi:hypothetical protein
MFTIRFLLVGSSMLLKTISTIKKFCLRGLDLV